MKNIWFSVIILCIFLCFAKQSYSQLKFLIEDFEGFADGFSDVDNKRNGLFTYGSIKTSIGTPDEKSESNYIGNRSLQVVKNESVVFGGWGKGVGANVELFQELDYLDFYIKTIQSSTALNIKIQLQEDDNGNGTFEKEQDDVWVYTLPLKEETAAWELISLPLDKFSDENPAGDGVFNVNYKQGKLICLIISFVNPSVSASQKEKPIKGSWLFDFFCFSKGKLPTGNSILEPPSATENDHCSIGTWSKEGITADFIDIATGFEKSFKHGSQKKLGIVHFFLPLAVDGSTSLNNYPDVTSINKIIKKGYIPMITLEDHFVNVRPRVKQPNLYSIVEGHFDHFLKLWAKEIKKVNGKVLVRILHEFNGDWYPWCISKNNNDPALLVNAYRHIHDIFTEQGVTNVKYIWCPNSTSFPQESWNFIMDAYPGDEYVDFVGLDIYNGAGQEMPVWRSFRKEGIENYFILTDKLPHKPLLVCETSSRERKKNEPGSNQNKAEWIEQMSETLKTDMSKVRLLSWFNEKETFKFNSSDEAKKAYLNSVLQDEYFKSGTEFFMLLLH